ncbi:glutathione peroxidase [Microbacterium terrisoli]|uniref:glutathione peroxidase n=1 Tax=Microbacterium terrisoli TaxID=3242192 RepID=UPI002805D6DA|nr:glutathione peroxidase [Microbacterium protaetiae]
MSDQSPQNLREIPFSTADGRAASLSDFDGKLLLVVNVASKCGLTPQYEQLEQLQRTYGDRGFTVLGFPCNQFMGQEPGTMEDILTFCSNTYGVTFPVFEKIKVNGPHAAPLYKALKKAKDPEGKHGPIRWNFEKFVLTPDGEVHRYRPQTRPDDPAIVQVIEANLPPQD